MKVLLTLGKQAGPDLFSLPIALLSELFSLPIA
jgi:hypothetical protein